MRTYAIESLAHHDLPDHLSSATEADVEDVLRRAAAHLGRPSVTVERVSSVVPGSCIASVDVVAFVGGPGGTPILVARADLH